MASAHPPPSAIKQRGPTGHHSTHGGRYRHASAVGQGYRVPRRPASPAPHHPCPVQARPPTAGVVKWLAVVRAIAAGDRAGAARWLATMTQYAQAHHNLRYQAVAVELAGALAGGTPLADLPCLVWGGGHARRRSAREAGKDQVGEPR